MIFYKQILIIGIWICFLACSTLSAQQLSLEDLLLAPSALLQSELEVGGNVTYNTTEGNANDLNLLQIQQNGAELNLVRTLQVGDNNKATIAQIGAGNQLVLIQNGLGNQYTLLQEGINNSTIAIQNGANNIIQQELSNASNVYSEFIQNGDGNEIIHITSGQTNQNFLIQQNGNGLKATVIQSN